MRLRRAIATALVLATTTTTAATPAAADTWPTQIYDSFGECTRALYRLRNERRQEGDMGRWPTEHQYNAYVRYYLDCVEVDRNLWMIMRVPPRG